MHPGNRRSHDEARAHCTCRGSEAVVASKEAQCAELRRQGSAAGLQLQRGTVGSHTWAREGNWVAAMGAMAQELESTDGVRQ